MGDPGLPLNLTSTNDHGAVELQYPQSAFHCAFNIIKVRGPRCAPSGQLRIMNGMSPQNFT